MKTLSLASLAVLLATPLAGHAAPVASTPLVEVACTPATVAQGVACAAGAALVVAAITDPKALAETAEKVARDPVKELSKPVKKLIKKLKI